MKTYIGTKAVQAMEMTLRDAEKRFNRTIGAEYDIDHPGYLVIYKDGYESWSPKEAFDEAYRPLEDMLSKTCSQ